MLLFVLTSVTLIWSVHCREVTCLCHENYIIIKNGYVIWDTTYFANIGWHLCLNRFGRVCISHMCGIFCKTANTLIVLSLQTTIIVFYVHVFCEQRALLMYYLFASFHLKLVCRPATSMEYMLKSDEPTLGIFTPKQRVWAVVSCSRDQQWCSAQDVTMCA